jgi:hypothetical protein
MFACFVKYSTDINLIYSAQLQFYYNSSIQFHECQLCNAGSTVVKHFTHKPVVHGSNLQNQPRHEDLFHVRGRVTRGFGKNCPIFQKVAPKVSIPKNAKISISKPKMKVQNIYIKPLLKP